MRCCSARKLSFLKITFCLLRTIPDWRGTHIIYAPISVHMHSINVAGYSLHSALLAVCSYEIWSDDEANEANDDAGALDENGWHYLFALSFFFMCLNDFGLRLYRKLRAGDHDCAPRKDRKRFVAEAVEAALAQHDAVQAVHRAGAAAARRGEQAPGVESDDNGCAACCKRLSLKPTLGERSINKALRREVLAYTTDGIAQSIDCEANTADLYCADAAFSHSLHDAPCSACNRSCTTSTCCTIRQTWGRRDG